MRIVIQRVSRASVTIDGNIKSAIGKGYLILVGVEETDSEADAEWLVKKVIGLRVFDDENGVMNLNIGQIGGDILVVSQFTLFASVKKGNRPSWLRASPPRDFRALIRVLLPPIGGRNRQESGYRRVRRRHESGTCERWTGNYLHGHEEQGMRKQ